MNCHLRDFIFLLAAVLLSACNSPDTEKQGPAQSLAKEALPDDAKDVDANSQTDESQNAAVKVPQPIEPPAQGWLAFPVSSWVEHHTDRSRGDLHDRRTLESVDGDDATIRFQSLRNGEWTEGGPRKGSGPLYPSQLGEQQQRDDIEELTIGNKSFSCTVTTYLWTDERSDNQHEFTLWQAGDVRLPCRTVVDMEIAVPTNTLKYEFTKRGENTSITYTSAITSLNKSKKVNGQTINCVEETFSAAGTERGNKGQMNGVQLLSRQVPGSLVHRHWEFGRQKSPPTVIDVRVVAFGKSKPKDLIAAEPAVAQIRLTATKGGSLKQATIAIDGTGHVVKISDADDLKPVVSAWASRVKSEVKQCYCDAVVDPNLHIGILYQTLEHVRPVLTMSYPDPAEIKKIGRRTNILVRVAFDDARDDVFFFPLFKPGVQVSLNEAERETRYIRLKVAAPGRTKVQLDGAALGEGEAAYNDLNQKLGAIIGERVKSNHLAYLEITISPDFRVSTRDIASALEECRLVADQDGKQIEHVPQLTVYTPRRTVQSDEPFFTSELETVESEVELSPRKNSETDEAVEPVISPEDFERK
jgi:hypothetical protein